MKRILYIVANVRMSNGVTSVIMNHYQKLIDAGYQADFCAMYNWGSPYVDKIKKSGGNYYILPQINGSLNEVADENSDERFGGPDERKSFAYMDYLIKKGRYDIVHIHILGRYALMASKLAKKNKVPYRIYHSHNPRYINNLHSLLFTLFYDTQCIYYCNKYLACSSLAGKSMFGHRKFSVIRNTIDSSQIHYTEDGRKRIREDLGISSDTLVIGTVCRQTHQKNPYFIVDIFEQINMKCPNSKFIWAGTGEMETEIKGYVENKGLKEDIFFVGNRADMADIYSAMDVFILPSRFEGFGLVLIEAQACGLPVFASDVVPVDTKITELIHFISLKRNADEWTNEILAELNKYGDRLFYKKKIAEAGFDRQNNNDLVNYYDELLN